MFVTDLHIHSTFSDGKLAIPEIVDLYGARGFGAIAITDHLCESKTVLGKAAVYMNRTLTPAVFPLYLEILKSEAERAWEQYKMVVIPGVELTRGSVRILALGINQYISADGRTRELCERVRAQGAVTVAGYTPRLWERRERLAGSFDAWEAADGRKIIAGVIKSQFPKLAASGLHSKKDINSWKTVFKCEREQGAILEAIRKQDLGFTYYDGVSNDIFEYIGAGDLGSHDRPDAVRYGVVPRALSLKALRRQRRLLTSASGLHLKAIKRRRERDERKSRELLPAELPKV